MVTNIPEEAKTQWKLASEAKSPEKKKYLNYNRSFR